MATLTEIEIAMVNKIKQYYHDQIMLGLQQANQEIPPFPTDDQHKQEFLTALANLESDIEFEHMCQAEAAQKSLAAFDALDAQTKIDLGIDHLFP